MSKYLKNYNIRTRRPKKVILTKEVIGQCFRCKDTFTVFYTDLEGVEPSSTYKETMEGTLIHKCGGIVNLWRM